MARTTRRTTGWALSAAGAALIVSVAALAQGAAADVPGAIAAEPAITAPPVQRARQQATHDSKCGGQFARFLKQLTSPPNPIGSDCNWREEW